MKIGRQIGIAINLHKLSQIIIDLIIIKCEYKIYSTTWSEDSERETTFKRNSGERRQKLSELPLSEAHSFSEEISCLVFRWKKNEREEAKKRSRAFIQKYAYSLPKGFRSSLICKQVQRALHQHEINSVWSAASTVNRFRPKYSHAEVELIDAKLFEQKSEYWGKYVCVFFPWFNTVKVFTFGYFLINHDDCEYVLII